MAKKEKDVRVVQKQLDELIEVARSAVNGYEKYLLDDLNYSNLAKIMTNLREHLPMGTTGSTEK